jgi:uncharacterized membrane protein YhdT
VVEMGKDIKISEVQLATLVSLGYVVWWVIFAFGFNGNLGTVLGFPGWFFYSVILGWVLCSIVTYFVVKNFFKEEEYENEHN